jgi:hypothetical protein
MPRPQLKRQPRPHSHTTITQSRSETEVAEKPLGEQRSDQCAGISDQFQALHLKIDSYSLPRAAI